MADDAFVARGLSKSFGVTRALHDVDLSVRRGEIHALLGHNGCGKSTLVKLISGYIEPDAGTMEFGDRSAGRASVAVVHQDLALCDTATVLENCCMNDYIVKGGVIDWKTERKNVDALLGTLEADFTADTRVADLGPAGRAITAIARALKRRGDKGLGLLVLDESTAALRGPDADKVLATARAVAREGGGVLFVTHHLSEVFAAADRATILSGGTVVDRVEVGNISEEGLLELIAGAPQAALSELVNTGEDGTAPVLLEASGLSGESVTGVSLKVHSGEIVGLTGAAGAGFDDVPYLLAGVNPATAGSVSVGGRLYRGRSALHARRAGVGLVPSDRLRQGVLVSATVRENLSPGTRAVGRRRGLLHAAAEKRWAARVCANYEVRPDNPEAPMSSLSGGNQQKVLLARVLEYEPAVAILHEPTQGVDEGTRRGLMTRVRNKVAAGAGILYVSADIEEVAESSHRVLVMRKGHIVAEFPGGRGSIEEINAASYL